MKEPCSDLVASVFVRFASVKPVSKSFVTPSQVPVRNLASPFRCHSDMGIPHVLGVPIPKTPGIWASPVTLTQIAKVMPISLGFWEWGWRKRGGAHITVTLVSSVTLSRLKHVTRNA